MTPSTLLVPESHRDLLTRPLFGHLATIRPDGRPQANPMWFAWRGTRDMDAGETDEWGRATGDPVRCPAEPVALWVGRRGWD
ncbi:pyridoxamine 5'-phosphate oxidase family protein [Streptomyces sp. NPDC093261]|uniref:pyridoxamine 5'-phosphate oxidase family protein n=1 Tax=Streptomyces sp. NPDC093261 TaxID=3366037 RepID=UPI0037F5AF67